MHDAAFARAVLPAPATILGLPLRPYSIGHELHLLRENSPLLQLDSPLPTLQSALPTLPDPRVALSYAALVCCNTWRENQRLNHDWFIRPKLALWRLRLRLGRVDFTRETLAWLAYRDAGSLEFPLSHVSRPDRKPSRPPGAPFPLRILQFVILHLGIREPDAYDYPYGLAKMHWATYWETQDGLEIHNEHDEAHERFVAEQEALAAANPPAPLPPRRPRKPV